VKLNCTELCGCTAEEDNCENLEVEVDEEQNGDDDDEQNDEGGQNDE
jgi:hypothetical protein